MTSEIKDNCKHEPSGTVYQVDIIPPIIYQICKKCGKYYLDSAPYKEFSK